MISLDHLSVLNYGRVSELPDLREKLRAAGYRILELRGERVRDRVSLFRSISEDLLQGEPVENWDGLGDSLRNALGELRDSRMALLWSHTDHMLGGALPDLIQFLDIVTGIARRLYSGNRTLVVFLLGDGPNFES